MCLIQKQVVLHIVNSLICLILAKSSPTDLEITSVRIGSGLLFAHEIRAPTDIINNISVIFFITSKFI